MAFTKNDDVEGLIWYGLSDTLDISLSEESSESEKARGLLVEIDVNEEDIDCGEVLKSWMVSLTIVDGF